MSKMKHMKKLLIVKDCYSEADNNLLCSIEDVSFFVYVGKLYCNNIDDKVKVIESVKQDVASVYDVKHLTELSNECDCVLLLDRLGNSFYEYTKVALCYLAALKDKAVLINSNIFTNTFLRLSNHQIRKWYVFGTVDSKYFSNCNYRLTLADSELNSVNFVLFDKEYNSELNLMKKNFSNTLNTAVDIAFSFYNQQNFF
ncbi:hypothetical protein [Candidatus Fokinia crypta]|uniref:Uncharacterized protein n=1 Tax=Candidatus Fokinia crypta TaxID=1920990 RepID=A0ABZ0UPK5_9RICK|nr:hypothetical protein [Candidatus Fokinia cryptica]WPX97597.1 hypothetical protein Fokcrypt_00102 [Candidatus Fokinia cryptica]